MIAKVSSPKREELNRAKGSKLDDVKAYKKKLRVNNEVGTGEYYSITVLQESITLLFVRNKSLSGEVLKTLMVSPETCSNYTNLFAQRSLDVFIKCKTSRKLENVLLLKIMQQKVGTFHLKKLSF